MARVRWGSLVLGLEDTGSRMSRLGKSELVYDDSCPWARSWTTSTRSLGRTSAPWPETWSPTVCPSLAVIGPFAHDQFVDAVADDVVVAAVPADAPVAPAVVARTVAAAVAFVAAVAHSGRRPRRKGPYGQRNDPRGCRGG